MKKLIVFIVLFNIAHLFSQKDNKTIFDNNQIININYNKNLRLSINDYLTFWYTTKNIAFKDLEKYDSLFKPHFIENNKKLSVFDMPKNLYLKGKIVNTTKDTIHLILSTSVTLKTEVFFQSNFQTFNSNIGKHLNNDEKYSQEVPNSIDFYLYPNETLNLVLKTEVFLTQTSISKITLYTKDAYESMLLEFYRNNHMDTLWFALLSGGLFLLFFYNIFMFFKTKHKTYIYYSAYLCFTFLNLSLIIDRVQFNVFGNVLAYYNLIQEATYTFSFIFYTLFVRSMLINVSETIKKIFIVYIAFMLAYILYIIIASIYNLLNLTLLDVIIAVIFRLVTLTFAVVILLQLLKNYNHHYLKYIFIGSLILTFSYIIHVVLNIINGPKLYNHFFNLIGSLLEILFFTYALHIKTLYIEKEKIKVENLSDIKAKFFANISHEFRTPLTLIKSPLQILSAKNVSEADNKQLMMIDKNANRMLELVDQLLELSKIDSGQLKLLFKQGNISHFLTSLIEPFELLALEKQFEFKKDIQKNNVLNYFDKDVLEKMVSNLLSNALKYTKEKGKIEIKSKQEDNWLLLEISNETFNLKSEDISKIFDYFYQKDNNMTGFGIGLTLVKELVELYQGTIETKLILDNLQITLKLPLTIDNKNAIIVNEQKVHDIVANEVIKNTDIPLLLLVDDNADIRMILKEIFIDNFKIIEAENGEQALRIAKKEIPDCIISDVMMPKMNGFEFTRQIKNNELTSFIPVILLTAKTSDEAHLEGLKSTADTFLTKPFNNDIVLATVNQLINERKKLHDRYSQELVLRPVDIVINSIDEKFIEKIQQVLDKELSNADFSAEDFAKAVGMSRMQLHRKLKSLLGVTTSEFLRTERLKVAAELLKKGNGNISDVAYAVGFNDVSYFSKCFKEMYGCTPTEML